MDVTECTSIPWHDPWYKDNFSPCFRQLFIERLVPCGVVAVSLATLAISALRYRFGRRSCRRSSSNSAAYTSLLGDQGTRQRSRRHSGYGAASGRDRRALSSNGDAGSDSNSDDDEIDDESAYLLETEQVGEQSLETQSPSSYTRLPPSTRDILLVIFTFAQATLSICIYRSSSTISKHENNSFFELILWLWAAALCTYLLFRKDPALPSPSPHLRLVYFVDLTIESIKVRTALLAYSRGDTMSLPAVEISMMAIAALLFMASFTQQRRRHGRSSHSLSSSSDKYPPAPEITASISQILFFSWLDPLIYLGYKRSLEPTDVYDLLPEQRSVRVCARWRHERREYIHKHGSDRRSLMRRMFWLFRYRLMLQCIWSLVNTVFIFTGPFFLKRILTYMEDPTIYTREQAFWCVAGLLIGGTIATVCQSQAFWLGRKIGLEIKSIIIGEVYAKSLRRRDAANEEGVTPSTGIKTKGGDGDNSSELEDKDDEATSTGKITNLMAVDANKVSELSAYLHILYQLPAVIIAANIMLYQLLGMASIAGLFATLVLVPIQWWTINLWRAFQDKLMKASDKRMNITNEIMQGVRIIKFFAWEPQFEKQVASIRGLELSILRKRYFVLTVSIIIFFIAPVFVTLTTFGVYTTVMGKQLTASIAFTALALFKTLRGPMDQLPDFISSTLQAKVSLDRVSKFLDEEETPKYKLSKLTRRAQEDFVGHTRRASYAEVVGATVIGFIGASFSWKSSTLAPTAASSTTAVNAAAVAESANSDEREPLLSASNLNTDTDAGSNQNMATGTESSAFELQDLTVSFPVGKLSIIAGPTGCGKTSLLMALLGEMRLTAGRLMVPGAAFSTRSMLGEDQADQFELQESVAYVAQQAWLLNDTIRGNIVFGLPFDEKRYHEVVRMCALSRDFEILEAGDMTEIGERGITLSGGQKQRVCLARAIYSPARHVIMDDCLSAVDAHTAKHLYDNCLMSPYMSERTRILVTHAVGLTIKGASVVVVMQEGRIAAAGTPMEVLRSGKLSEETLREADEGQQNAATRAESMLADKGKAADLDEAAAAAAVADGKTIDQRFDGLSGSGGKGAKADAKPKSAKDDEQKGKLTTEEGWSRGHVQWRVYVAYLKATGGIWFWSILVILFLVTQALQVAQDWWLREWAASYSTPVPVATAGHPVAHAAQDSKLLEIPALSGQAGEAASSLMPLLVTNAISGLKQRFVEAGVEATGGHSQASMSYFIFVYLAIALLSIVVILGRSLMQFWGSLKASKYLHETLLHTVLRAPVRFFDTTPVGRLINRFSKDIETIDQSLNSSLAIYITEVSASLAILIVIAVITPTFTIVAVIIAGIYWIIGVLYIPTSRELKRFDSVTRSPIYTQFGETISGVSTIRAYGQESRFRIANYIKVDDNNRPFVYMWAMNRWLSTRVDLAGALVSFMAGLLALTTTGRMDAGLAGLSLTYALNFTEHVLWVVRLYSVNEMNLNSVERVVEYLDVEPEAPVTVPGHVPPPEWPAQGRIQVENLELRYAANQPPVIRNISFDVKPYEKVGIVGRTGAGKSTLTLAMFRFMEASAGHIRIDGIDISQIGVGDLRSRLTIIPQDPVLFTGTIRSNLDPFNEHADDELWLALRRAHLLGDEDESATRPLGSKHKARYSNIGGGNGSGDEQFPSSSRASTVGDESHANGGLEMGGSRSSGHSQLNVSQTVALGRTITDLEMVVAENGSNFSQGQRQLIALARALVKRTRVIILDEATASVDFDTDAKIQTTIRNEFTESTLLCIAHRLRTIVDYDKVLVLDQGEIVEYDTPYNLLSKSDGLFRHMCLKSGEYDHLFSAAERKHRQTVATTGDQN